MSADYWLGVATIPALLAAIVVLVGLYALLLSRSRADGIGCLRCDWHHDTTRHPWWLSQIKWLLHKRRHDGEVKHR